MTQDGPAPPGHRLPAAWRRGLAGAGLALLAAALLATGLASAIPPGPGAAFNIELLREMQVTAALAGALALAVAAMDRQIVQLGEWLAGPVERADRWLRRGRRWQALLAAMVLLAAGLLAAYSIGRHNALNSKAYDLGLHAQVWWNTSQGRLFASSVEVDNYLGDHVSPIILLLAPLYRLWPDPRALLLLQATALAAGAAPLALLARERLLHAWPTSARAVALVLALLYLSYPPLGFVNRFEFHEEALAVPLLLLAFWALEARRLRLMSLALAVALLTKEDVGLTVAAFGVWAWWRGRAATQRARSGDRPEQSADLPKHGAVPITLSGSGTQPAAARDAGEESPQQARPGPLRQTSEVLRTDRPEQTRMHRDRRLQTAGLAWAAIGVTWSLLALFVVIPYFRGAESDTLARYAWLGSGPADVLTGALQHPGRIAGHLLGEPRRLWMLFKFLLPVGFLPLLSPAILIALPGLAINWLAGNLYQASIYFHYAALMIPTVFAAAVYGMERVARGGGLGQETGPSAHRSPFTVHRLPLTLLWLAACALLALGFDQAWQPQTGSDAWPNYSLTPVIDRGAFRAAAAQLPADAAVATTEAYAAHLANRQGLYLLHDPRILFVVDRVDWVLVDLKDHRYGVEPRQVYGLLRWVADARGLQVCHFAGDVVLLGPGCNDPVATVAYQSRLAELQHQAVSEPVDPVLLEYVGPAYFQP